MGLQIGDIVLKKAIELSDLKGKTLAVDAFNIIYQFLSTIRQPDGTPLKDKKGRITSHLSGLFYRNVALLKEGIKLIYVFDGEPPALKGATAERRRAVKEAAHEAYKAAREEEDIEAMGKYGKQLAVLDEPKIKQSKELLEAMGIAVVQAPSEGEAQASYMAKHDKSIYAIASQDYDSLIFEAPRLLQNMTLAKKRKTRSGYVEVKPQLIKLTDVRKELGINQDQLICLGILSGTDYNPKGVPGVGPKKALKFVQEYKTPKKIFQAIEDHEKYELDFDWVAVYNELKNPKVDKKYKIKFGKFDFEAVKRILGEHDFSEERIESQFQKIREHIEESKQKTLF